MIGSEIEQLVVMKMEELTPFSSIQNAHKLLAGGDKIDEVKPIYTYIHSHMEESANEMLLIAPLTHLPIVNATINDIQTNSNVCTLRFPENYLRLYTLFMASWSRPVHTIIYPDDVRYNEQFNPWTRGTIQKPTVYYKGKEDGQVVVQCFSKAPAVLEFAYVATYHPQIDYSREVGELIALNCAKKIYGIYGANENIAIMTNEIQQVLGAMQYDRQKGQ